MLAWKICKLFSLVHGKGGEWKGEEKLDNNQTASPAQQAGESVGENPVENLLPIQFLRIPAPSLSPSHRICLPRAQQGLALPFHEMAMDCKTTSLDSPGTVNPCGGEEQRNKGNIPS